MFKSMFMKYAIQYALRGIGMGAAIVAGSLTAKFGVDGETASAVQTGIVAAGGILLDKGVAWYQEREIKLRADNQAAKVAIVAKETNVAIPESKVVAAQEAYDKKKAVLGKTD